MRQNKTFRLPRKKKKQLHKLNASLTLRIIELSERLQNLKGLRNEPSIPPTFILDITGITVIDYLKDWCENLDVAAERKALDIIDISNHIPNYHRAMPFILMNSSPLPKPELFPIDPKPVSNDWLKLSISPGYMFDRGQMQLFHNTRFNSI